LEEGNSDPLGRSSLEHGAHSPPELSALKEEELLFPGASFDGLRPGPAAAPGVQAGLHHPQEGPPGIPPLLTADAIQLHKEGSVLRRSNGFMRGECYPDQQFPFLTGGQEESGSSLRAGKPQLGQGLFRRDAKALGSPGIQEALVGLVFHLSLPKASSATVEVLSS